MTEQRPNEDARSPDEGKNAAAPEGAAEIADGESIGEPDHLADELPEDLDVTAYVGPYTFPDVRRRLIPAVIYLVMVVGCVVGFFVSGNRGLLAAAIVLGLIAAYHVLAAWPLRVDQTEALATASRAVGFPIGHSSAQLAFRRLRSKPVWHVLVYSADSPPSIRGLVEVDAVNGEILGEYTERNPEDWSEMLETD